MPRRASAEELAEMANLKDRSIRIIRFTGNLRGLRIVGEDVAEWAKALSAADQQKLDSVLASRFEKGIAGEREDSQDEIALILRRGQIDGEYEFRLLIARADEIHANDSKAEELEKINCYSEAWRI